MADDYDNLEAIICSFYVLERIIQELEDRLDDPDYVGLYSRAKRYRSNFHKRLARTLRDSLAGMAIGEARYYTRSYHGEYYVPQLDGYYGSGRNKVYDDLDQFSVLDAIKLEELFNSDGWGAAYGGPAWGDICKRIPEYEVKSPTLFCDLMMHIVHNNGCAFNKELLVSCQDSTTVKRLLDAKLNDDILDYPIKRQYDNFYLCKPIYEFYMQMRELIKKKEGREIGSERWYHCEEFQLASVNWSKQSIIEILEREDDYGEEEMEEMEEQERKRRWDFRRNPLMEQMPRR